MNMVFLTWRIRFRKRPDKGTGHAQADGHQEGGNQAAGDIEKLELAQLVGVDEGEGEDDAEHGGDGGFHREQCLALLLYFQLPDQGDDDGFRGGADDGAQNQRRQQLQVGEPEGQSGNHGHTEGKDDQGQGHGPGYDGTLGAQLQGEAALQQDNYQGDGGEDGPYLDEEGGGQYSQDGTEADAEYDEEDDIGHHDAVE